MNRTKTRSKPASRGYTLYILLCDDGTLYTGITTDPRRRFLEHKAGLGGRYTRSRGVSRIVYTESCPDRSSALRRECAVKALSRAEKLRIITRARRT